MSVKSQKKLLLPKGHKDGPKYSTLGRMSVNPYAYKNIQQKLLVHKINPFNLKITPLSFDSEKLSKIQLVIADLIGTIHVDMHSELKAIWKLINNKKITKKHKQNLIKQISSPVLTKTELQNHAQKWHNSIYRNQQINRWTQTVKKRYSLIRTKK